jgi:glycosyltransferase involved in cell wall biosynthesis
MPPAETTFEVFPFQCTLRAGSMIVAHVLTSLEIGGSERLTVELAGGQAAAGHQVMVVSLAPAGEGEGEGALAPAFRARGVTVHRLGKRPGFDALLPLRLARLFRRNRVAVAHLHNRLPLIYGAPAARLAGALAVHTRHGPRPSGPRQQWLLRGAGRLLHAYVAVSPELADLARDRGECTQERISVIENGIDVRRFELPAERRATARAALGLPADAWVIGSVGRLAPEKDHQFLVRASAALLGDKGRLLIVGLGPERRAIEAEAAARAVTPWVSLPGARDDIPEVLAALDLFVLSSRMEGMPLVVLEAMAAGVPVVATAVGGLPKLIQDGETGFLCPPGEEAALRETLASLRRDPARARAAATKARAQTVARNSSQRMVERYLELYQRLGAAPGPAPGTAP